MSPDEGPSGRDRELDVGAVGTRLRCLAMRNLHEVRVGGHVGVAELGIHAGRQQEAMADAIHVEACAVGDAADLGPRDDVDDVTEGGPGTRQRGDCRVHLAGLLDRHAVVHVHACDDLADRRIVGAADGHDQAVVDDDLQKSVPFGAENPAGDEHVGLRVDVEDENVAVAWSAVVRAGRGDETGESDEAHCD